jgi:hypothetical protein
VIITIYIKVYNVLFRVDLQSIAGSFHRVILKVQKIVVCRIYYRFSLGRERRKEQSCRERESENLCVCFWVSL